MATRVQPAEVLEIMDTALTIDQITPFVTSANVYVTNALSSTGMSDELLKELEKWLAAHMASVTKERIAKEEGAGGAYIKYAGDWGKELNSSSYGQMALMLDTSGTLKDLLNGKRQASIYAVPGA